MKKEYKTPESLAIALNMEASILTPSIELSNDKLGSSSEMRSNRNGWDDDEVEED